MSSDELREAEIAKSSVPRPRPMGRAFSELRAKLEAAGFTVESEEPGEAFMAHAQFEREWQRRADGQVRFFEPTDCSGVLRKLDQNGPVWTVQCDLCRFEIDVKVPSERLAEYLIGRAGIPEMFAGKEFEKDDPLQQPTLAACRTWLRQFNSLKLVENIPAPAVWGPAGRGKSHLLALLVETLIRRTQVEAIYRSWLAMKDELRDAIAVGAFEGTYSRLKNVPMLALDDLGAGRMSDASKEWLAGLVDHRYAKQLPLAIATNVPPQRWAEDFGERTASRLRGMCLPFYLEGADRRVGGPQQSLDVAA